MSGPLRVSDAILFLLGNVGLMRALVGHIEDQPDWGNIVAISRRGSTRPSGSIAHQNQGSLGKRNIEECRRRGQRKAPADLSNEEEGGQGPQYIEQEDGYENAE